MSRPADWDYACPLQGVQQTPLEVKVVEVVDLLEKLGVAVLGQHGLQSHGGHMLTTASGYIRLQYFIVFHSMFIAIQCNS